MHATHQFFYVIDSFIAFSHLLFDNSIQQTRGEIFCLFIIAVAAAGVDHKTPDLVGKYGPPDLVKLETM